MMPYIHIILPSYALMAVIGGMFAVGITYFRIDRYKIAFKEYLALLICCIVGGFIGSKVLYAITQIPWLIENFSFTNLVLLIPKSGFVFYGGLFGVLGAIFFVTRKDKEYRKKILLLCVPAMPLFHAIGRIGCFLTGCCYGKPLGFSVNLGFVVVDRIPVQLIESIAEFIIFMVVLIVAKKKAESDVLRLYLLTYAVVRFLDEFLRGDEIRGLLFGVSTSQWISLAIIVYYVIRGIRGRISPCAEWENHNN